MDSDVTILGYKEWIEIVTVTKLKLSGNENYCKFQVGYQIIKWVEF